MLTIDVSGSLLIDTTGESDPTGQGADRFMLDLSGDVSIARIINVGGHIRVDVGVAGPNTWRVDVGLTGRLGPIEISGSAWIQSDGQFSVSIYGGIYFGVPGFSMSGGLEGTISLTKSGRDYFYNPSDVYTLDISIRGSVRLEIIGIGLGASVTLGGTAVFDPARSDTVLSLYAEGCVEILGIETCGGGTIATVAIPVSIFPTPPPILASVDENGNMQLNVGARSSQRKVANSTIDEEYRMTDMGAGRVRIEAFGYTETYSGITSIQGDFGGGNDTLILMDGFSVPVTAHGGTGNDMLASLGTRAVVFYGDDGNDTLIGGNCADELFGGAGDDYLEGGLGVDSLSADVGNDLVYGTIASLAGDTILGGSGTDSLEVHGTASADAFTVSADSGRLKIVRGTSGTLSASGFEDVVVTPEEGADSVTLVGDLRDAGILSISVNLMEGDERSPDTVTGSLLNSADNLRISAGQESPVLSKQYGFNPEHGVDFTVSTSTMLWSEG
ncbi:MAG: calcium-binding protein, partial [Planctomyces sp.]